MNRRHFFKSIGGIGFALVVGKFLPEISQDTTELSSKTKKVLDEIHYTQDDWELEGDPAFAFWNNEKDAIYDHLELKNWDSLSDEALTNFESTSNKFPGLDWIINTGNHNNCKCALE